MKSSCQTDTKLSNQTEDQNQDIISDVEDNTESSQNQTSVQTNTKLCENIQLKPLQNQDSFYSVIFTKAIANPYLKLQKKLSEVFLLAYTHAENERSKEQHPKRIDAANHLLRRQEPKSNQLLQQLNESTQHCSSKWL